jgi:hypothetical protein
MHNNKTNALIRALSIAAMALFASCSAPDLQTAISKEEADTVLREFSMIRFEQNLYLPRPNANKEILSQIAGRKNLQLNALLKALSEMHPSVYKKIL